MKTTDKNKYSNFYVWSLGCQQNDRDGAILVEVLKKLGLCESSPGDADIIFIIACAVRQTGVDRVYGQVNNWQGKKIIVSGCVLDSDKKKLAKKDVIFWDIEKTNELPNILNLDKANANALLEDSIEASNYVPIMYGCNNFCSYCATPYTRGRERSLKKEKIIQDVSRLIQAGNKQILLLGQNVNSYKDPETGTGFEDLLRTLNDIGGDFEIAFTSNHPKDMTDGIIKAVATLSKIKKEIHLPVQSGSNKILKAMNRPYTREKYLKIVDKIKKASSKIDITTDVIIGFPGETEEDFEQTIDIFEKVGYKMAYINKYSPRVGTAAYKLGDPISWKEKQRRWHELDKVLSKTRH